VVAAGPVPAIQTTDYVLEKAVFTGLAKSLGGTPRVILS
jgi:hypothetical protein